MLLNPAKAQLLIPMNTAIKLTFLFCCFTLVTFASPPNKGKMQPCKIRFQNLQAAEGYTFYWRADHGNFTHFFTKDSTFIIPADEKKPDGGYFWGINSTTKSSTNTIEFRNNFSPDKLIIINAVVNDSIVFTQHDIANENTIGQQSNEDESKEIKKEEPQESNNTLLFSVGVAALAAAVALFFIRRNKKKQKA